MNRTQPSRRAVLMLMTLAAVLPACGGDEGASEVGLDPEIAVTTTESGLQYQQLAAGSGSAAESGDRLKIHYTGWLEDGTQFDSSRDRGRPYDLVLGVGQAIAGWDEGIDGMKLGGKRKLRIPAELGYGDNGYKDVIPPGAVLLFEVELVEIGG